MKINDYCHWGKRAQKTKLTVMHFSVFAYPQTVRINLKAACMLIQPVLVKVRSRNPSKQFSPYPPLRSNVLLFSPGSLTHESFGPILPYLIHLGSFGFVCGCSW